MLEWGKTQRPATRHTLVNVVHEGPSEEVTMKTHPDIQTVALTIAFLILSGAFFFVIVGVFGLAFAIAGMLIAIVATVALCYIRPSEEQAQ